MPTPDPKATDLPYLKRLQWPTQDRFLIERTMIRNGGKLHGLGEGLAYHTKAAIAALWPHFYWHRWSHLQIETMAEWDEVPIQGPASSGKTYVAAAYGLLQYFVWPKGTTVVMSSTTREGLQLRIWGSIKELYNVAKERRSYLPGRLIESRYMLTSAAEPRSSDEAADFRDGIIGVACMQGNTFRGLSNYVGLKNDRIILMADEASLMGPGFLDSLANLRKNPSFKFICMGNPKDPGDALGKAAEPAAHLGGWGGHSSEAKTQTWPTRARRGMAIQLCGYDSPNYDYPRGLNPFKGIITPEQIEDDLAYYGESSLQFSMMNLGVMPKDASTRRVITRLLAEQRQAFESATFSGPMTEILSLDPAYKGIGGDRCVLTHLRFGMGLSGRPILAFAAPQIMVPIDAGSRATAEEQIAHFVREYAVSRNISPENFGLDATMAGTLVAQIGLTWSPSIIAITCGGAPPDRKIREGDPKLESEAYGKFVSALWFASYYAMDAGQLRNVPQDAVEEGSMREWKVNNNQSARRKDPVIDVEPKEDMKKRMGRSPDLWDSFVVGVEVARRRGFTIVGGANAIVNKGVLPGWLQLLARKSNSFRRQHELDYSTK